MTITLKLSGKDSIYEGIISDVYNFASKGTSALGLDEYRVQVKADVDDNQELKEMNGYDVTMKFLLYEGKDKLWVPASAVFQTDKQDFVLQIIDGKAVKTAVEVEYQTSTQSVITSGIERGVRIISDVG